MLSLSDPIWPKLHGGYRIPYDASKALTRMESGESVWDELWSELHHQGDVGVASYAAVPHIVRISATRPRLDWDLYALAATIEIERHRKGNPPIPDWLEPSYRKAWGTLTALALSDLSGSLDELILRSALSVVAIGRGQLKLGVLLNHFDTSEIDDYVENRLSWSTLYS
jgi:hypothetical protein